MSNFFIEQLEISNSQLENILHKINEVFKNLYSEMQGKTCFAFQLKTIK